MVSAGVAACLVAVGPCGRRAGQVEDRQRDPGAGLAEPCRVVLQHRVLLGERGGGQAGRASAELVAAGAVRSADQLGDELPVELFELGGVGALGEVCQIGQVRQAGQVRQIRQFGQSGEISGVAVVRGGRLAGTGDLGMSLRSTGSGMGGGPSRRRWPGAVPADDPAEAPGKSLVLARALPPRCRHPPTLGVFLAGPIETDHWCAGMRVLRVRSTPEVDSGFQSGVRNGVRRHRIPRGPPVLQMG